MNVYVIVVLFCVITTLLILVEGLDFCGRYQYGTIEYKDEKQDYKIKLEKTHGTRYDDRCTYRVQNINGKRRKIEYLRFETKKDDSTKVDLPEGKKLYDDLESKERTLIHARLPNVDVVFTVYN